MGGDMTAQSELGRGSVFQFTIRAKISELAGSAEPQAVKRAIALEPGQPRYRMIIADDNPENRQLLVNMLTPFNFDLREAANGQEALKLWQAWQPHLIWMDLRMPVLDGYKAAQQIKAAPHGRETVIIVLSASILDEDRIKVIAAGCDGFLRKPFREHEIIELLAAHLGVRFIYAEDAPNLPPSSENAAAEMARVPAEILEQLTAAAQFNDFSVITNLIEEIRRMLPAAADALAAYADNFEYVGLLEYIQRFLKSRSH